MNNDWFEKEQLHFAADAGDIEKIKQLIEGGFDINAFDEGMSYTPLHYAVKNGNLKAIKVLLSLGADVNAYDEEQIGETPLGAVAASCSYEVAETLVKAGADPTIPGWMQLTALDRAKERKKPEGRRVYELLLSTAKKHFRYAP